MSKANRSRPAPSRGKGPRTARLGELLREVVAEELKRIDDPRLELVSITSVDVDADLNRAIVHYDSLAGEAGDAEILEAFTARRVRLQAAVGRQIHARKTPILQFRPDEVIRQAERIEQILRQERREAAHRSRRERRWPGVDRPSSTAWSSSTSPPGSPATTWWPCSAAGSGSGGSATRARWTRALRACSWWASVP